MTLLGFVVLLTALPFLLAFLFRERGYSLRSLVALVAALSITIAGIAVFLGATRRQAAQTLMNPEARSATAELNAMAQAARQERGHPAGAGPAWGPGKRSGYSFAIARQGPGQFTATAAPLDPERRGVLWLFVDETGVVRFHETRPATSKDPALDPDP